MDRPTDTIELITADYYQLILFDRLSHPKAWDLIHRCQALASEHGPDEVRFQALMVVLQLAQHLPVEEASSTWAQAAALLIDGYVNTPKICRLLEDYSVLPAGLRRAADACLERILAETKSDAVIAGCRYAKLTQAVVKEQCCGGLSENERRATLEQLAALRSTHGRELNANLRLHFGETIDEVTRADIFELEHLHVGKTAPDIAGEDVDGIPFRLSDYSGKVVLLKFWGYW